MEPLSAATPAGGAPLSPSAHRDTFARDHLPPVSQWPEFVFGLPELRYPARLNCAEELLDATIGRFGGARPALYDAAGRMWTYAGLRERVDRIARVLVEDFGLVPGNRVLLRGPNAPWLAACWLAALKAGAVVVTTMPLLRAGELRVVAGKARVDLALCEERYTDELLRAQVAGLRVVGYGGEDSELARRAAVKSGGFGAVATAADDVALIAFTSGTSGEPKATMHFHRDVLAIADTFAARVLRPVPEDLFTGSPPLAFTFGLGGLLVFPLRAGAASLLLEKAAPGELFAAVGRHRATVLFTAPTAYRAALREIGGYDLSSLRRCVSAGETLPADTWRAFEAATGQRVIDGIGATELLHVFIASADEEIRPGATGRPVPGFAARVVDGGGRPVPDGVAGRLAVRGPTGCRYLADDRQRDYVQDGWNITGDIYVRDGDGYFWYQARADDMIVTAGYNVAAPEVEQAVLRHPSVAGCAVVGVPDAERGSVVKAVVVPAEGHAPASAAAADRLAREIQDRVKAEIAPYKYPRIVEFVAELPCSSTGKVQRGVLRQAHTARAVDTRGNG
ncbi:MULTISPECIES: AMP-binding protein [Streptomyces]|uniref:2-aminobenzoate-CoA ligase n=1 Tax=Streptomyces kasugaensis TaxID=1946 RepID=A0A4Q9HN01_STRKA|nr:AMP-binding protein [Streptomyces kasugaensis]TBO56223.1 2-aminobenzoate-CoA ligase [Streptomyces kasugaensis]WSK10432.1 AMP-binding protein [Streptomyces celluloflavus]WSK17133.1 AMP-binding protein [Streptomyces celluloflavus]